MLKVYADRNHYFSNHRSRLNNICKLIWDVDRSEQGAVQSKFHPMFLDEPDIKKADICILTMLWNYYTKYSQEDLALMEIEAARKHNKKIIVFNTRDYRTIIPSDEIILFEPAGLKSKTNCFYHSGLPFFIKDYNQLYNQGIIHYRQKQMKPVVGFCGQANFSLRKKIWRTSTNNYHKIKHLLGLEKGEPPPFETTSFRGKVLQLFEGKSGIETNFVIRDKMRAGDSDIQSDFNDNKLAFIKNILESDYTICTRGHGNYSIRFYETICLGRIPIFIDTDCLLPFQDEINYKDIFPWIDVLDLPYAAEIVADFHARLSKDDFIELQMACRKLWVDHMTHDGFEYDFAKKMKQITRNQ